MHKDCERVLISEAELKTIVKDIAAKINQDYKEKNLLLVGLLKGSVLFMADLMKELEVDCKIDFICVSRFIRCFSRWEKYQ